MNDIEVKSVSKSYGRGKKAVPVLRDIDLNIGAGELVAILGPSGCGKTTLLNLIAGLDNPNKGSIRIRDQDWEGLSDRKIALHRHKNLGMVFQFFYLFQDLNVLQNVLLPTRIAKTAFSAKLAKKRAEELIERMGLMARLKHLPNELSGGELQRVAIARALILDPPILICDEPTGNLDSVSGAEIISYIKDLSLNSKKTVMIVTHDDRIAKIANRIIHINDGGIV
ncbi:MAG: ABC-type lipoprotein export system ATPase subunit [Candidatus Omnitrophota bacterium]|jgi:ABC-type lipoprotein export system ATPase subunit